MLQILEASKYEWIKYNNVIFRYGGNNYVAKIGNAVLIVTKKQLLDLFLEFA